MKNVEKVSEKDWLIVLKIALSFGMLGGHRFYCKRFVSAFIIFFSFVSIIFLMIFPAVFLKRRDNLCLFIMLFCIFFNIVVNFVDLVLIVKKKFKDNEGNVVSRCDFSNKESYDYYIIGRFYNSKLVELSVKEENLTEEEKKKYSDKDVMVLYRLTRSHRDFAGMAGLYHFYAGKDNLGFLSCFVTSLGGAFFWLAFFLPIKIFKDICVFFVFSLWGLVTFSDLCHRKIIVNLNFKDKDGKTIAINHFKCNDLMEKEDGKMSRKKR